MKNPEKKLSFFEIFWLFQNDRQRMAIYVFMNELITKRIYTPEECEI